MDILLSGLQIRNNGGATVERSVHEHTDIVIVGKTIGSNKNFDKIELLKNKGCNIRIMHEEEFREIQIFEGVEGYGNEPKDDEG